jgi:hypothetical protein
MSREEASKSLADAMGAYDRIEDELFRLTLSVDGIDDWTHVDRLMEERGAALQRCQAAVAATFEVETAHR